MNTPIDINQLTIGQARELSALFQSPQPNPPSEKLWIIGKIYQIRTVTMIYTGRLVEVTNLELGLVDAAWIADAGRWAQACESQAYEEVEPYPAGKLVIVGRGSVLDAVEVSNVNQSQK